MRHLLLALIVLVAACGGAATVSDSTSPDSFEALFGADALVQPVEVVDCTLENGESTSCYRLVASSQPADLGTTGPFCPRTVTDEHGMVDWQGENPGLYALDADFWEMVTALGYSYVNADGTVNVADPAGAPPQNDACLEATPDGSYTLAMLIPVTPSMLATPTQLDTVSQVGVALDGATIFGDPPGTAAIPALDACGGHNDPSGYYHWHFGPDSIQEILDADHVDLECDHPQNGDALVGFAYDGYAIFGPTDNGEVPGDLDACSGHVGQTEQLGEVYHYHLSLEVPNLPTCRVGAAPEGKLTSPDNPDVQLPDGGPGGPGGGSPPGGGPGT